MPEITQLDPTLVTSIQRSIQETLAQATTLRADQLDLGEWTRSAAHQPFVLTCDSFAREGRYLVFWANPASWDWSPVQRGTLQKTRGGTIKHQWRSRLRPTYFDEIPVSISFQTGSILPIRVPQQGVSPRATANGQAINIPGAAGQVTRVVTPPGLLNFYDYLEMKDEPAILDDGEPNLVSIIACSSAFAQIVLRGFINPDGFSFSENSEDGNTLGWNDSFTIVRTYPAFKAAQLRAVFESGIDYASVAIAQQNAQAATRASSTEDPEQRRLRQERSREQAAANFSGVPAPNPANTPPNVEQNLRTGAGTNPAVTGTVQPAPPSSEIAGPAATSAREARMEVLLMQRASGTLSADGAREIEQLNAIDNQARTQRATNADANDRASEAPRTNVPNRVPDPGATARGPTTGLSRAQITTETQGIVERMAAGTATPADTARLDVLNRDLNVVNSARVPQRRR